MANVIMAEWFSDHYYKVRVDKADHFIASVTTKLGVERKYPIERWRGDIGNREADLRMYEASERGKRIHHAMSIYLLGGIVLYNPWNKPTYTDQQIEEFKKQANGFVFVLKEQGEMLDVWKLQQFFDIVKPKILFSEKIVYSVGDDIAGTLDLALEIKAGTYPVSGAKGLVIPKDGVYIGDLKTGKTVNEEMFRQVVPYAHAFEKMGLGEPEGCFILHTGADTSRGIPGLAVKLCMKEGFKSYLEDFFHLSAIWKRNNPNAGPEIFSFPTLIQRKVTV